MIVGRNKENDYIISTCNTVLLAIADVRRNNGKDDETHHERIDIKFRRSNLQVDELVSESRP